MSQPLTPELKDKLRVMAEVGRKPEALARVFGITVGEVNEILTELPPETPEPIHPSGMHPE